jgi:hypothetical protein
MFFFQISGENRVWQSCDVGNGVGLPPKRGLPVRCDGGCNVQNDGAKEKCNSSRIIWRYENDVEGKSSVV